ncbi:acyltransferase family protein [Hymenobacter sp. HD11105]
MPHLPAQPAYFPALTGVRALAAWLVFFHHFNPFPESSMGWRLAREWHTGVALFFVLSGLLICVRYRDKVELSNRWWKQYLLNRVARIYPMYLLLTCFTFVVLHLQPAYDVTRLWANYSMTDQLLAIVLNITFLRGFFDSFAFTGIVQGWTLTVEECFYFAAPFLLVGLRRSPINLLLYGLLLPTFGAALVYYAPHPLGFFESFTFLFTLTFFGRCFEFLAGMGVALLILNRFQAMRAGAFYTWAGLAWIIGVMGIMAWIDDPALAEEKINLPLFIFLNIGLLVPGVCALYVGLIREQSSLRRLLETKLFILLGRASYSFYLIHMGILSRFLDLHVSTNSLVKFVLTNILAVLLFKAIEVPMHRSLIKRYRWQP